VVSAHFGRHPDAEIYASQPGLGPILAARVLGEFGDDPHRYIDAKARKSHAGTAPITRAPGTKRESCSPATPATAVSATPDSSGRSARCADHQQPAPTTWHSAPAVPGTRPPSVSSPTGSSASSTCLKTHSPYNEHTAWAHHTTAAA
jgi:hypothetical protein